MSKADPTISGEGQGGAVFTRGTLDVQASAFVSNEARGAQPRSTGPWRVIGGIGRGGAICDEGNLRL